MGRVAVVTLTGGCPDAFPLICKYMARQTRRPDLWVVSDDSLERTKHDKAGLARNMLRALDSVPPHHDIVVMEDDDWYAAEHVETVAAALEGRRVCVGAAEIAHYHVGARRWRTEVAPIKEGQHHTALAFTGIPRCRAQQARAVFEAHAAKGGGACLPLWQAIGGSPSLPRTAVGMKGIPGAGVSRKHDAAAVAGWKKDPDLVKLREWIGDDAEAYARYG